jgi:hypothetical protein
MVTMAEDDGSDTSGDVAGDDAPTRLEAPATRRRVSGTDLESRFEDWRSGRREARSARTPEESARRVRRVLGAVMSTAVLALAFAGGQAGRAFEAESASDAARISHLRSQVEDAEAAPLPQDFKGRLSGLAEAAARDAKAVADAQQRFAELHYEASMEPDSGNGAPNAATLEIAEHRRALAPLFSSDSYLASEEDAYSWTSIAPFEPSTEIDPRFPWYVRYDGTKASAPADYRWTVEAVTPEVTAQEETAATSTAHVLWTCRETTSGQALAWASATYSYDGKVGKFDQLDVVVTVAGDLHKQGGSR